MLFQVEMTVSLPADMVTETSDALKRTERARFQELQRSGKWRHIWRVVGQYANISIFDVDSNEELHALLLSLPLFAYMQIGIRPLCRHPSSIHDDDR